MSNKGKMVYRSLVVVFIVGVLIFTLAYTTKETSNVLDTKDNKTDIIDNTEIVDAIPENVEKKETVIKNNIKKKLASNKKVEGKKEEMVFENLKNETTKIKEVIQPKEEVVIKEIKKTDEFIDFDHLDKPLSKEDKNIEVISNHTLDEVDLGLDIPEELD